MPAGTGHCGVSVWQALEVEQGQDSTHPIQQDGDAERFEDSARPSWLRLRHSLVKWQFLDWCSSVCGAPGKTRELIAVAIGPRANASTTVGRGQGCGSAATASVIPLRSGLARGKLAATAPHKWCPLRPSPLSVVGPLPLAPFLFGAVCHDLCPMSCSGPFSPCRAAATPVPLQIRVSPDHSSCASPQCCCLPQSLQV